VYIKYYPRRFYAVFFIFLLFLLLLIARLFFIQFFRSAYLKSIAEKQYNFYVELEPRRGTIFDRKLRPQAININVDSLYAMPDEIKDKEKLIRKLSGILKLGYSFLRNRLYRDKSFIWIARKLSTAEVSAIKSLNLGGLGFIKESKRCYPNASLASHIIGFSGLDNTGLEGVEFSYDNYLKGSSGFALFLRDARQKKLDLWEKMVLPKDGYNVVLTIDEVMQYITERELDKMCKDFHISQASIIIMDPHTGQILALANRPAFDLNDTEKIDQKIRRNHAVCDLFEPGSVFKIVTASAAIEENKVREEDKFFCENGSYRVANHILHDHRPHGWLTFREVIEQSSNIGTTKVAQGLGADLLYHYIKLFGFGAKLGIDLPGEVSGMIKPPRGWSKTSIGAVPIGQEVGVSALQLVSAISVIANGGLLMRPYIVKEIQDKYGEQIKEFSPVVINKVISAETASRIKEILVGAVENGTGKLSRVEGFRVAGKTGTAQKLEPDGAYSHNKFIASFIGFAPADDPVIAVCVIADEPHPYYFGGVVCAPVFKRVVSDVLKYLEITPLPGNVQVNPIRDSNSLNRLNEAKNTD
jgi:cell division protein FtsI/penicillin-binding protein 2